MERALGVPRLRRVGCSRGSLRSRRCATGCAALPPPDAIARLGASLDVY